MSYVLKINPYFYTENVSKVNATTTAKVRLTFELKYQPDWVINPVVVLAKLGNTSFTLNNDAFIDSTNVITYSGTLQIKNPALWSPTNPNLTDLKIYVINIM